LLFFKTKVVFTQMIINKMHGAHLLPISMWHCFHSHSKRNQDGKQKIMKKGRGRLIYILDFIKEDNRHLIVRY
jgi:hypothetical protein